MLSLGQFFWYSRALELQQWRCCCLSFLQEEAAIQASWCAHLHAKYFSTATGSLASLGLSSSLAHSLWAISLVRSRTFSGALAAGLGFWVYGLGLGLREASAPVWHTACGSSAWYAAGLFQVRLGACCCLSGAQV